MPSRASQSTIRLQPTSFAISTDRTERSIAYWRSPGSFEVYPPSTVLPCSQRRGATNSATGTQGGNNAGGNNPAGAVQAIQQLRNQQAAQRAAAGVQANANANAVAQARAKANQQAAGGAGVE